MSERTGTAPSLMEYVKVMERRDNPGRRQAILRILGNMGIKAEIQGCRWPNVKNVVVDFSGDGKAASLLFTAHYDTVKGSPGANDNGSGTAVLLGLCRELKKIPALPVRVVFFDREEAWFRTPLLRLGLLGSLCYAGKKSRRGLSEVYNLEYCGRGDTLIVWPVKKDGERRKTVKTVEKIARCLSIPSFEGYVPWYLLSSDHLPFRLKGIDAVTLSMLPGETLPALEKVIGSEGSVFSAYRRKDLPASLSVRHSRDDDSGLLEDTALRKMLTLTLELVKQHFADASVV